jgi:hypothetical protein
MTAAGKINASNVNDTHRIIVKVLEDGTVRESSTKTGEGVQVARVTGKDFRAAGRYEARGKYIIHTTAGSFEAAPIQTMWLAPEDAAGVKRAQVEAIEENKRQDRAATPAEVAAPAEADAIRTAAEAARVAPTQAEAAEIMAAAMGLPTEALADWAATNWVGTGPTPAELVESMDEATTDRCPNEWHRTAPARRRMLCPECPAPFTLTEAEVEENAAQSERENLADAEAARTENEAPGGLYGPVVARPTPSRVLALQFQGRALRLPETGLTFDLPPLAHGRELVRLADIAPSNLLTLHSQAGKVGPNSSEANTEEPEMTATTEIQTPATETKNHTGSTVVALIERVWDAIRAEHPELPPVIVTTGSGEGMKWGHFRPESWKLADSGEKYHEFFLASEALAKGAKQVLQTTIHEAAHTLNRVRGNKDTSRQNRYHNGTFRKTAEELGLEHKGASPDKTLGFSFVTLTEATKVKYAAILAELDRELKLTGLLPFWLGGTDGQDGDEDERGGEKITKPKGGEDEGETKTPSGNLKATCGCEEPIIIRLSRKVLDLGVVRCDQCSELFTAA